MVNFKTSQYPMEMATKIMGQAQGRDSGADIVSGAQKGIATGMQLIEGIEKYKERKKNAKLMADAIVKAKATPEFQEYNQKTGGMAEASLTDDPKGTLAAWTTYEANKTQKEEEFRKEDLALEKEERGREFDLNMQDRKEKFALSMQEKKEKQKGTDDKYIEIMNQKNKLDTQVDQAQKYLDKILNTLAGDDTDEMNEVVVTNPIARKAALDLEKAKRDMYLFKPIYDQAVQNKKTKLMGSEETAEDILGIGF